ncbi:hypothetical protein QYZ15_21715 [Xanthomonas campestris pv. campestris]|uniref:hypothetical protein n=1 Tax=Xanthomonas campestris TaxID=339 RepID=UPI002AD254F8|nr:hypothetical protein [Xanthomonas campestris]MEA0709487.1 hypothetical protein [Xanthomonas campestris pv. campestris]MEA0742660.1 hypothetical protein [Xanthomonas campestris pv. campestris]
MNGQDILATLDQAYAALYSAAETPEQFDLAEQVFQAHARIADILDAAAVMAKAVQS